jgi:hypothetical protein
MGFLGSFLRKGRPATAPGKEASWQSRDMAELRERFYESFDRSLIESMVFPNPRRLEQAERAHPIGEGRHFRAFVLQSNQSFKESLVIQLPKPTFLGHEPEQRTQAWLNCMRRIQNAKIALIPPFEVVVVEQRLQCLVTPFGSGGADQALPRWQPVNDYVSLTVRELRGMRLEIDDYIQVRTMHGIPFICDFSDIRALRNT